MGALPKTWCNASPAMQVPANFIADAQQVSVVALDSAPQTYATGQGMPAVPMGSSAQAIQVCPDQSIDSPLTCRAFQAV